MRGTFRTDAATAVRGGESMTEAAADPAVGALRLRPHQKAAVADLLSTLSRAPRVTFISACGTGKTVTSAALARRLCDGGRVLVVVPTLDLVGQAVTAYAHAGVRGPRIAVCSDQELTRARRGAKADAATTSPTELAALARAGAAVFATYASLPVIEAAHAECALPAWDLLVIDEAHRTSGALGRPWARIHDDSAIRAARRLYMTATPRVLDESGEPIASMDDETVYGPVAHRLGFGAAIEAGILADYRLAVPAVADAQTAALIQQGDVLQAGDAAVGARDLALAAALLRTSRELGLWRVASYHSRVAGARAFARAVEAAAAHTGQDAVWARAVWGKIPAADRRELLHRFAEPGADLRLLANARLLGEGVDVPAMDTVVFADAKYSQIDTVQAVGRALRLSTPGKVATIVIALFLSPDDNTDSALEGSAYAPLWKTLRALHAHDDRIGARIREAGGSGARATSGERHRAVLDWLHVSGIPLPEDFSLALNLRVLDRKSAEWARGYASARREHRKTGSLDVLQVYVDDQGFALGSWLWNQRYLYSLGRLQDARINALERLGIVWRPRAEAWERNFDLVRQAAAVHGHLCLPRDTVFGGARIGAWLDNQRARSEQLSEERAARLAGLDPWWNPPWATSWQRRFYELHAYMKA